MKPRVRAAHGGAAGPRATPAGERTSRPASDSALILGDEDASLLDIVDNVLNKGVVLSGDITIGLASVDLIYARLSLLLCAADRVMPEEDADLMTRHSKRHTRRGKSRPGTR
jgi:hypothetical protein